MEFAVGSNLQFDRLEAKAIRQFILDQVPVYSSPTVQNISGHVRSLVGWLVVRGKIQKSLLHAVPSVAARKLGLPKGIDDRKVQKLLKSCDLRTHSGRRTHAALLLMAHLGLRSGEVASLRFDCIDWHRGEITVRSKGSENTLPLPHSVGQALASYIKKSRPKNSSPQIILRLWAPIGPVTSQAISQILRSQCQRAGLEALATHRLRHTIATKMLKKGNSLSEIGQVLRHSNPATTAIYAKVDRASLNEVVSQWPGIVS
jgi:site-specific recombinase XerD